MDESLNIRQLVRENIRDLVPYSSARDEYAGSASVFLDANENPYNSPLNRYPDPRQTEVKRMIAGIRGQQVENLFLGNGSDEGIDLLFRVLCEPGTDNVITVDPTYGMYGVCARINNVEQRSVLLRSDFSLDADAVLKAIDDRTKMIFLCSPNNPTSNSPDREVVMRIIHEVNCIVVVDEAYIDFSREQGLLQLVPEKKNLVVLQTLSKAWGLAGIRLGMVFAHEELIGYLSNVKYPYNINSLTLESAMKSLAVTNSREKWVNQILEERNRLRERLTLFAFVKEIFPSDANFLLVKMDHPSEVYEFLMNRGIIVRDRSSVPLCEGCLRITVGTKKENQLLCDALDVYNQTMDNR
ncbi:MAG: histidinol-phosphate transaminase [Bacteroidota bacterium]